MIHEVIAIELASAQYHTQKAYMLALHRVTTTSIVTLRFTDMESLDLFTQFLEYEEGYVYSVVRDDISRLGFEYRKDGLACFTFAPGYHLDAEAYAL